MWQFRKIDNPKKEVAHDGHTHSKDMESGKARNGIQLKCGWSYRSKSQQQRRWHNALWDMARAARGFGRGELTDTARKSGRMSRRKWADTIFTLKDVSGRSPVRQSTVAKRLGSDPNLGRIVTVRGGSKMMFSSRCKLWKERKMQALLMSVLTKK